MERYYIEQPTGNGYNKTTTIADLIPCGRENAIKHKELLRACILAGIVEDKKGADREMRRQMQRAKMDYTILNLQDGHGYYRPTHNDLLDLQRYIKQEKKRIRACVQNVSHAEKLYADFVAGRLEVERMD